MTEPEAPAWLDAGDPNCEHVWPEGYGTLTCRKCGLSHNFPPVQLTLIAPSSPPPGPPAEPRQRVARKQDSAMKALTEVKAQRPPAPGELSVTDDEVRYAFRRAFEADRLYLDCETDGLDRREAGARAVGLSFCDGTDWATYIPWGHSEYPGEQTPQADVELVKRCWQYLVANRNPAKWFLFNKPFDRGMLAATLGAEIPWDNASYDVHHLAFLCDENGSHKLKDLGVRHIDPNANEEQLALAPYLGDLKNSGHRKVPPMAEAPYAAEDARLTWKLDMFFRPRVMQEDLLEVLRLETALMPVLADMEERGVKVDRQYMAEQQALALQMLAEREQAFSRITGYTGSTSSPDQLRDLLYIEWKLPVLRRTPSGEPSTDKYAIERLKHANPDRAEALGLLEEISSIGMLVETFFGPIQDRVDVFGYCHPAYNAMVRTGRTSSYRPNFQQLPKKENPFGLNVRKGVVVPEGKAWVLIDYSQIELRVLAHYADANMRKAYIDGAADLHQVTADQMGVSRAIAKTINFGSVYGGGVATLARSAGVTEAKMKEFKAMYRRVYPGVYPFSKQAEHLARRRGWVKTLSGRRRRLSEDWYRAANAIVQGSAADVAKRALIDLNAVLQERFPGEACVVGFVHDEFHVECTKGLEQDVAALVKQTMCAAYADKLTVPLDAEGRISYTSWGDAG